MCGADDTSRKTAVIPSCLATIVETSEDSRYNQKQYIANIVFSTAISAAAIGSISPASVEQSIAPHASKN
jgi:hypothetical protein